ncbi:MAG: phosphomannose isomerase type II C-terminal cupin domain [Alphaproteobacteria bacterium]
MNNYQKGISDTRPWGVWETIEVGNNFCVKKITVTPDKILSLQSHEHRDEHWIIVEGEAVVTLGDAEFVKKANESIFIPKQVKHRIANKTSKDMVFIEVQTGAVLDENDIVRYEDMYGRV